MKRSARGRWVSWSAGGALLLFLVLPIVALAVTTSVASLSAGLRHSLVAPALLLSLQTTTLSLVLVVVPGTALAWRMVQAPGRLARLIEVIVQLPIVVPPAVAGVGLLLAFGRRGLLGPWLARAGIAVPFTTTAVVLAEVFVSAPFFVQAAVSAFRRLDPTLLVVARSLGASPARAFFRVALPIAGPALAAGAAMSWARALGEFGATLMFAGNLSGRTQTLPLAIYTTMESDLRAAQALALVLLVVAFALLILFRQGLRSLEPRPPSA